jgi:hypothetical protein
VFDAVLIGDLSPVFSEMLAAFIVKVVEEELTLRSIPEGCNIQSFLVLGITVKHETIVLELLGYRKNGS